MTVLADLKRYQIVWTRSDGVVLPRIDVVSAFDAKSACRKIVKAVGGFTIGNAEEVLHTIRSRSDGRFSTRAAHPQLQRFHALCCDLMDRGATRAEFERIGDHIRHGGMNWAKRPDVGALIAEGKDQRGPQLPRILTDIDGCAECGGVSADAIDEAEEDPMWAAAATKAGYKL